MGKELFAEFKNNIINISYGKYNLKFGKTTFWLDGKEIETVNISHLTEFEVEKVVSRLIRTVEFEFEHQWKRSCEWRFEATIEK